jgi:hypothetical protein
MFFKQISNVYNSNINLIENIYNLIISILNYIIYPYYFLLNIIYKKNNLKQRNKIDIKNNNDLHNSICFFIKNLSNKWKYNNIEDIDLLCDILYLYNKYNKFNDNNNNIEIYSQDEYMKYYTLGWYIYQNINDR